MNDPIINVEVEEEMENFAEEVNKHLTFDLVAPQGIKGHAFDYDGSLYIVMSNGDVITFDWDIPCSGGKGTYAMGINGIDEFHFPVVDDHPGLYMREAYKEYLDYVLTFKKQPRSIEAKEASNGLGVRLVSY